MEDLQINDNIKLINNKELVSDLQKRKKLDDFDFDKYKDLIGYVADIKKDAISCIYTIGSHRTTIIVHRNSLKRIFMKTFSVKAYQSNVQTIRKPEAVTEDVGPKKTRINPILHPFNRNLKLLSDQIEKGDVETLKKLCVNNPHIHDCEDLKKTTIFHHASSKGDLDILQVVKDAGCDANAEDLEGDSIMQHAVYGDKSQSVDYIYFYFPHLTKKVNKKGNTPFLTACFARKIQIAIMLLKKDPSVINNVNNDGNAAIHYVCSNNDNDPDLPILLQAMLHCRELEISLTNADGLNCYHIACHKGIKSTVEALIAHCQRRQHNELLRQLTPNNETGAQLALRHKHIELTRNIILKEPMKWSDLVISSKHGSILHTATKIGCLELVKLIVLYDERIVGVKNSKGETAIDIATQLCKASSLEINLDGRNILNFLTGFWTEPRMT